jgi:hypothetical protein
MHKIFYKKPQEKLGLFLEIQFLEFVSRQLKVERFR